MRILQLTGSSAGGVRRHAHELAGALAGVGHQVRLAGPAEVIADASVPTALVDIADRPRATDAAAVRAVRALARDADVVHAHGLRAGGLAALALTGLPTRLVVTLHNLPVGGAKVQAITTLLGRLVAARAAVVLGVSGDLVAQARAWGARAAERALVPAPPRGAAPTRAQARDQLGLDPDEPLVFTLARLAPQKGIDTLLVPAARLLAGTGVTWWVAGDGPVRAAVEPVIAGEGLPVRLLGARSDVPDLLAAADVVVSTSSWEGQPLNLQEALAAGCAIVATDVGGTAEVTGDAAVLVPYPDARALADAVAHLLDDPLAAARAREAATARAATLPTVADLLAQAHRVYGW